MGFISIASPSGSRSRKSVRFAAPRLTLATVNQPERQRHTQPTRLPAPWNQNIDTRVNLVCGNDYMEMGCAREMSPRQRRCDSPTCPAEVAPVALLPTLRQGTDYIDRQRWSVLLACRSGAGAATEYLGLRQTDCIFSYMFVHSTYFIFGI